MTRSQGGEKKKDQQKIPRGVRISEAGWEGVSLERIAQTSLPASAISGWGKEAAKADHG